MIKSSFKLILAALAATAALAGCVQEIAPSDFENDKINPAAEGTRVITVSFAPQSQTKTTLDKDGLTPEFKANEDTIKVALKNGTDEPEDCVVENDEKGNLVIKTNLVGDLVAVYPSSAAKVQDNFIVGVTVPSKQTGKFADANICCDTIPANSQSATFVNKTAVLRFYVGSEIEVTSVTLESQSESFGPDIGTKITVNASEGKTLYDQMPQTQDRRVCYIAVPYGTFSQLTITTTAKTQNPKPKQLTNVTFENNKIYSVFIPYYIQVGDQKWAYCNIGAFLPEEPGKYFAWGSIEGFKYHYEPEWQFDNAYEFSWENCPYIVSYEGDSDQDYTFSKYVIHQKFWGGTGSMDNKQTLEPEDDAAHVAWQDQWRMPKKAELEQLANLQASSIYGKYISVDDKLILPVTGHGVAEDLTQYDCDGGYWSSDLSESEYLGSYAYYLFFRIESQEINEQVSTTQRNNGYPIRPIYGPAPASEKPTSLSGVFTVGEGKAVRFSRGNLYWDGTSSPGAYKFETEQYNYRLYPGKASDYAFLDKSTVTPVNTVGSFWWIKNGETAGTPYSPEYNIKTELCSGNDILFTNETAIAPNTDFTVNGDKGVWRALSGGSGGEWEYLLEKRKDAAEKVGTATVNGVTGTIILPDTFTDPSVNSAFGGGAFVPLDSIPEDMNFGDNIYDLDSWKKMESEGAVFLPAAGHVQTDVDKNQTKCHYWSSSALTGLTSYSIMIDLTNSPGHYGENSYLTSCQSPRSTLRISVRLVTDAPVAGSTVDDLNVKDEDTDNWQ